MSLGRVLLVSLAVLAAGYGMWRYWWTALDHFPEQDFCEFGPIVNARYQALLSEARQRQAKGEGPWTRLRGATRTSIDDPSGAGAQIAARMEDLSARLTSLHERQAAAHAVMRAMGGFLINSKLSEGIDHSRELAAGRVPETFLSVAYAVHSNYRIDGGALLAPFAEFRVILRGQDVSEASDAPAVQSVIRNSRENRFSVIGLDTSVLFGMLGSPQPYGAYVFQVPPGHTCPPKLDQRVAKIYENWVAQRPQK
jgi:hypothetical protein